MTGTTVASGFAGGLGLFLAGLWLATDGLKIALGRRLSVNLVRWTRDRGRAFLTGSLFGVASPATDVCTRSTIGLINVGPLALHNALWMVIGSSLGALGIVWCVAMFGFHGSLDGLGMAVIGIGIGLRLTGPGSLRGAWGQSLLGAGMVALGIKVLSSSLLAMGPTLRLDAINASFGLRIAVLIVAGGLATAALRSAGVCLVFVLLAATAGSLELASAAALAIGTSLGVCASSYFAFREGTPQAKRLALGSCGYHGLVACLGVVMLLCTLPALNDLPGPLRHPAVALATFVSLTHAVAAMMFWPLESPLLNFLRGKFLSQESDERLSRRLDANMLAVPDLALDGLSQEVTEVRTISMRLARTVLTGERLTAFRSKNDLVRVECLAQAVNEHVTRLSSCNLPGHVSCVLLDLVRAAQGYRDLGERSVSLRNLSLGRGDIQNGELASRLRNLQLTLLRFLGGDSESRSDVNEVRGDLQDVRQQLVETRKRLATHYAASMPPAELEHCLERLSAIRQITEIGARASSSFARLRSDELMKEEPQETGEELDANGSRVSAMSISNFYRIQEGAPALTAEPKAQPRESLYVDEAEVDRRWRQGTDLAAGLVAPSGP